MTEKFPSDKLSQLLGSYRSDDSESDEADDETGRSGPKNDVESKADTSKPNTSSTHSFSLCYPVAASFATTKIK